MDHGGQSRLRSTARRASGPESRDSGTATNDTDTGIVSGLLAAAAADSVIAPWRSSNSVPTTLPL
jgi:hypothetical protein